MKCSKIQSLRSELLEVTVITDTVERTKSLPDREVKIATTPLHSKAGLKEMSSFWREENLRMCSCREGM